MKVGLFFGSFNPIHIGHLLIASHIANFYVDEVWFVVSPQNPFKNTNELLDAQARLTLVKVAIYKDDRFKSSDIEFQLPIPSYTINTLKELSEEHPGKEFFLIMGSDNYKQICTWKEANEITINYNLLIYDRNSHALTQENTPRKQHITDAPLLNISSTLIRDLIAKEKCFKYLVPEKVYEEIIKNNYFK